MNITSATFVKGIRGTDDIFKDGLSQVCFVGRSNVGKSSLINALTKEKNLAREGDKPGKTKEINFYLINNRRYLVDLPGYGYARASSKEREKLRNLIVWYLTESGAVLSRVVLIIDAVAGLTEFDRGMLGILQKEKRPYLLVINKIDKVTQKELSACRKDIENVTHDVEHIMMCSVKQGQGIDQLREALFTL